MFFSGKNHKEQKIEQLLLENYKMCIRDRDGTDTVRRATAVVTLGSDVDLLQERYQNTGRMLESYMLESIGGELLMLGYGMLEAWIRENTGYQVAAYHFFGDDEAHPLSAMPEDVYKRQGSGWCSPI